MDLAQFLLECDVLPPPMYQCQLFSQGQRSPPVVCDPTDRPNHPPCLTNCCTPYAISYFTAAGAAAAAA